LVNIDNIAEREVEAEVRENERAARETKATEDRRASARINAFEVSLNTGHRKLSLNVSFKLARSGNSSAVRRVIEEHQLDVIGPERIPKNAKKSQPEKYDTLLHAAASNCDPGLISFLLEKG
jgi:hypothetical protein